MSAIHARQYGIRNQERREAPTKTKPASVPAAHPLGERIREFARVANHGGTFDQLVERARRLGIENVPAVRAAINAKRPPISTSKKVERLLHIASLKGVKAMDLLHIAEEDGILHVRAVQNAIADVREKNLLPKEDGVRAKVLGEGRFRRPAEVICCEKKPTNVGNPCRKEATSGGSDKKSGKKKKK